MRRQWLVKRTRGATFSLEEIEAAIKADPRVEKCRQIGDTGVLVVALEVDDGDDTFDPLCPIEGLRGQAYFDPQVRHEPQEVGEPEPIAP